MEERRRKSRRENDCDHDAIISMEERINFIDEKIKEHLEGHKRFFWLIVGQIILFALALLKDYL